MVGTYRCKRRVVRWPLVVFENMLDISACNALVLYLAVNPQWEYAREKYSRRLFLVELGKALTAPYTARRMTLPRGERARDVALDIKTSRDEPPASRKNPTCLPNRLMHPGCIVWYIVHHQRSALGVIYAHMHQMQIFIRLCVPNAKNIFAQTIDS